MPQKLSHRIGDIVNFKGTSLGLLIIVKQLIPNEDKFMCSGWDPINYTSSFHVLHGFELANRNSADVYEDKVFNLGDVVVHRTGYNWESFVVIENLSAEGKYTCRYYNKAKNDYFNIRLFKYEIILKK
ncbi:MAG: hypothetical protein ACOH2A_04460 [Sphingobacteriaceae bacterium]